MRSLLSVGSLFVLLCGLALGWLIGGIVPEPIRNGDLEFRRTPYAGTWEDEPFVIDPTRRFEVPWQFADFDLHMDVELGEGVTFDLLMRRVEPRMIGSQLDYRQFHGRFVALRLTADRSGDPWFTRERLLLGDPDAGGVDLAPGHTATVWLKGRGRHLEANVAGRKLPAFEAEDECGAFLFVVHGGTAVLKSLSIVPLGQPYAWLWSRWLWLALGLAAALLVRLIGVACGHRAFMQGFLLLVPVGVVVILHVEVAPLWHPPPVALLVLLGAGACAALADRRRWALPMLLLVLLLGYLAPSFERDESDLDALFGEKAGSALAEAHAQLVRGPFLIHDVGPVEGRVFLLGGQLLYGMDDDVRHLEALLAGELRIVKKKRIDVPCLPTIDGYTAQQWAMFERFYTGYRPDVIVFGVSSEEAALDPRTGKPRSYPSDVERSLAAAREYCARTGASLVLFAGAGIGDQFLAVLRQEAGRGTPLVVAGAGEDRVVLSRRLAEVIAPLLP